MYRTLAIGAAGYVLSLTLQTCRSSWSARRTDTFGMCVIVEGRMDFVPYHAAGSTLRRCHLDCI
jgi:hypothetical protein